MLAILTYDSVGGRAPDWDATAGHHVARPVSSRDGKCGPLAERDVAAGSV